MLTRGGEKPLKHRFPWTEHEDRKLVFLWETGLRLSAIANRLQRTPSGIYRRAQDLGLSVGCPDGFEYIEQAAVRTGYCPATLHRILRFGGVVTHLSLSDPTIRRRGYFRRRYVNKDEVDAAVEKWCASEPIAAAAKRHALSDDTLRRWLRDAGVIDPARKDTKAPQRVASDVIDRVIGERRRVA
jgi:transposase-like protein